MLTKLTSPAAPVVTYIYILQMKTIIALVNDEVLQLQLQLQQHQPLHNSS